MLLVMVDGDVVGVSVGVAIASVSECKGREGGEGQEGCECKGGGVSVGVAIASVSECKGRG